MIMLIVVMVKVVQTFAECLLRRNIVILNWVKNL